MRCEIEDYKTGWFQVFLRFKPEEIDGVINALRSLKEGDHFHLTNEHEESSGVADIEISIQGIKESNNMRLF